MKKYGWIISLLLALSVVIWPVYAINNRVAEVENLYKDSDTISRTVEACGTATVSEVPVGEPNIGWNEFCGLIGQDYQVFYYFERNTNASANVIIHALTTSSTKFVLVAAKEINASTFETVVSFGLNGNSIFYTTQQNESTVFTAYFLVVICALLTWLLFYYIVSWAMVKLEQATYLKIRAKMAKDTRAKGGGGIGD